MNHAYRQTWNRKPNLDCCARNGADGVRPARAGRRLISGHAVFVIFFLSLLFGFRPLPVLGDTAQILEKEQARRQRTEQNDIRNLRQRREFVVHRSEAFITLPDREIDAEFSVATVPPTMKLQMLPDLDPEFFDGGGEVYDTGWANWAKVTRSDDNRFYMAAGDHRSRGANINLYEYRPRDDVIERVLDVGEALGWHDDMYTDGKIHGRMGIMPDGNLWAATHRGPRPTEAWYQAGYRGSWLFSYNIHTGESRNWGVPLVGNSLPYFNIDTERGIFFGSGGAGTVLSWDIHAKQVRFAGYPPNGWDWWQVGTWLDPRTGLFWSMDLSEEPYRIMSFDPELNRFERYDVEAPRHPMTGLQERWGRFGGNGGLTEPDEDGWTIHATGGFFYRFRPDGDNGPEIETMGMAWDRNRRRGPGQLAISPEGRYIYYVVRGDPAPLLQYDLATDRIKAIAFLQDFVFEKYGYWMFGSVFGMDVSNDGSFVVVLTNGAFEGRNRNYGFPALVVIEIPESERL